MIENLKRLLNELYHAKRGIGIYGLTKQLDNYITSLECAIEILEDIRINERSIQNGNIK